jgi:dihydropteroate synthase
MQKAFEAGASIINDVNALRAEGAVEMAVSLRADVCLMHMQGTPRTMQNNPSYDNVVSDIKVFFFKRGLMNVSELEWSLSQLLWILDLVLERI